MPNIAVKFEQRMEQYTEKSGMFSSSSYKLPTLSVSLTLSDLYRAAVQQMDLSDLTMFTYSKTKQEMEAAYASYKKYPDLGEPQTKQEIQLKPLIMNNPYKVKAHYFHTLDRYVSEIKDNLQHLDALIQRNLPGFGMAGTATPEPETFEL